MQGLALQTSNSIASSYGGKKKFSFLNVLDSLPSKKSIPTRRISPFSAGISSLCKFFYEYPFWFWVQEFDLIEWFVGMLVVKWI